MHIFPLSLKTTQDMQTTVPLIVPPMTDGCTECRITRVVRVRVRVGKIEGSESCFDGLRSNLGVEIVRCEWTMFVFLVNTAVILVKVPGIRQFVFLERESATDYGPKRIRSCL